MKIAALTMAFNETFFLPLWVEHYGREIGHDNLFVIDDSSTDGSTRALGRTNAMLKPRTLFDENFRAALISATQKLLLERYDVVIVTDVDELIVADPETGLGLGAYLESRPGFEIKSVVGLNVLQKIGHEGPLDLTRPLFEQRHFAQFDVVYCKPLVARVPVQWTPGFHGSGRRPEFDTNLLMFHLRAVDVDMAANRIRTLNGIRFSANSLARRHGLHFQMRWEEYRKHFFSTPESEFVAAEHNFDFIAPILHGYANVTAFDEEVRRRYKKRIVTEVPARFKASIVFPGPSPAQPTGEPPRFAAQPLLEEAMRVVLGGSSRST